MNFAERLLAGHDPRRPALLTLEGTHTHGELQHTARAVAGFLRDRGARKGDCVGLVADNSFFWITSIWSSRCCSLACLWQRSTG